MSEPCQQKEKIDRMEAVLMDINVKLAVIDERLKTKVTDIDKHILDGERQGGWRDRLVVVEEKVKGNERFAVVAGVIGGLIGAGAPSAVAGLARLVGIG